MASKSSKLIANKAKSAISFNTYMTNPSGTSTNFVSKMTTSKPDEASGHNKLNFFNYNWISKSNPNSQDRAIQENFHRLIVEEYDRQLAFYQRFQHSH